MNNEADEPQKVEFNTPLEAYQAYIDSLPEWLYTCVKARWVREWDNKPAFSTYQPPEVFNSKPPQAIACGGLLSSNSA